MSGTPFQPTWISTEPSCPKPAAASPVIALTAINRLPAVKRILAGFDPSPGQNATPRALVLPFGTLYSQTNLPVSASSASTREPAGRYMMLLMTIGVASGLAVGVAAAPRPPPRPPRPAASSPACSCVGA